MENSPSAVDGARTVYVIDDSNEMRRSLHFLLAAIGFTAWPFAGAADFIDNVDSLAPAPLLLDIRMPGIDGLDLMTMLRDRAIAWPVIIMTGHGEIPVAVKAMKLGAVEFLEKPFEADRLERALEHAFAVMADRTDAKNKLETARAPFDRLTPREHDIVALLAKGRANKAIAHELGLSVRTVEMHRANVMAKLDVRNAAGIVALAASAKAESAYSSE